MYYTSICAHIKKFGIFCAVKIRFFEVQKTGTICPCCKVTKKARPQRQAPPLYFYRRITFCITTQYVQFDFMIAYSAEFGVDSHVFFSFYLSYAYTDIGFSYVIKLNMRSFLQKQSQAQATHHVPCSLPLTCGVVMPRGQSIRPDIEGGTVFAQPDKFNHQFRVFCNFRH